MAQSTLYIHIGTPKTGTTALQGFLAKNRKTLKEHGAVFPDFGLVYKGVSRHRNAHFLVATKDPFHAKEMGVCMKILKQQAALYPKILISDESIWTFYGHPDVETKPFWEQLKAKLDGMDLDLKVIVYLRRQDQYAFSYYAQKIKEAEEIRTFRDYMLVDGPARARLDYKKELDLIASAIGKENLIVRRYDREGFGGSRGTIQSDFLEAVGLEYTPDLLEGNPDKNVTFHGQVLEAKRFYNMMEHPDLTRHEIVVAFHGAENRLKKNGRLLEGVYFTRQERRDFMDRYRAGNRAVAEEYLGTRILFDYTDLSGEDEQSSYTTEQITEVFSCMVDHLMLEEKELHYELWKKQPLKRLNARMELIRDHFRRDHRGKH
jgi:hypothetical protein